MEKDGKNPILYIIIAIIAIIVLMIAIYSLSYIPLFNISEIKIEGSEYSSSTLNRKLNPLVGQNRFKIDLSEIEKDLGNISVYENINLKYSFPRTIIAEVESLSTEAMLTDGTSFFVVKNSSLLQVEDEDVPYLAQKLVIIEISTSFREYLSKYKVDNSLLTVLKLAYDISSVLGNSSNLIQKIKYDNNNSNGFGQMVIELPNLNSVLYVREQVSSKRITDSIRIIQKEREDDPALLLTGVQSRYDLYQTALVKRN